MFVIYLFYCFQDPPPLMYGPYSSLPNLADFYSYIVDLSPANKLNLGTNTRSTRGRVGNWKTARLVCLRTVPKSFIFT